MSTNSPYRVDISIHAPRVGSDHFPTVDIEVVAISIHAPRVGSDKHNFGDIEATYKISIHAPRVGSDDTNLLISVSPFRFQSTLPVWGAT